MFEREHPIGNDRFESESGEDRSDVPTDIADDTDRNTPLVQLEQGLDGVGVGTPRLRVRDLGIDAFGQARREPIEGVEEVGPAPPVCLRRQVSALRLFLRCRAAGPDFFEVGLHLSPVDAGTWLDEIEDPLGVVNVEEGVAEVEQNCSESHHRSLADTAPYSMPTRMVDPDRPASRSPDQSAVTWRHRDVVRFLAENPAV